ncbi:MAG: recF [Gammaproteobacteria bacterium]|jgi:DNA replication and repair protein RecF|nr:recF [Gammaproteobacteria bacterium]
MTISRLIIQQLRNINQASIEPASQFNIIYGDNGSGKTSVLEAVYLLGLGRSFRSRTMNSIIQLGKEAVTVFGLVKEQQNNEIPLGIERKKDGAVFIRVQEHTINSIAELAHYLPLQIINQDSYQLLTGSPKQRRQFLDWGLFHVEQSFFPIWKRFQRSLQQRNACLRNKVSNAELKFWDKEFIDTALIIDQLRTHQLEQYKQIFVKRFKQLNDIDDIELIYKRGWNAELDLEQALAESLSRDRQYGFTHAGPHRADIDIKTGKMLASQLLSRGQQKLLTYSLLLAQGQLLTEYTHRKCVYLIDDMPAELDRHHIQSVLTSLTEMQAQLFITCIDPQAIAPAIKTAVKMFHVEQGVITAVDNREATS